jgi:hypothetical protein
MALFQKNMFFKIAVEISEQNSVEIHFSAEKSF